MVAVQVNFLENLLGLQSTLTFQSPLQFEMRESGFGGGVGSGGVVIFF